MGPINYRAAAFALVGLACIARYYSRGASQVDAALLYVGIPGFCLGLFFVLLPFWHWRRVQKRNSN
jgi:hypothetical protein